jgi:hypothetical protein
MPPETLDSFTFTASQVNERDLANRCLA